MLARLVAGALVALSLSAHATTTTIGFEDAGGNVFPVAGYQGFNWSGGYGANSWVVYPGSAPVFGGQETHSGNYFAWSNGGTDLVLSSADGKAFSFDSVWARGGFDNQTLVATGSLNGTQLYSQTFSLGMTYGLETFNFQGIDTLTLSTGRNTLYDDITVTRASAVPEPVTPALLLAGLGLVGLVARRRRI